MRLDNWNYGLLLLGILGAAAVIFADPVSRFLEAAMAAIGISGVGVVLAMSLLLLAVILHQQLRQAEAVKRVRQDTEAVSGDVRRAEERARELEHLVRLGEALGATLDPKAIHHTVTQYRQPVVGQREIWMTVKTDGWRLAIGGPKPSESSPEQLWDPNRQPGAWDTFPMFAAGKLVGLME